MARRTVAVVGGGCAGVLAGGELLRCTDADVVLIDEDEPGGGVAYGAAQPWHLLNSRAGAMSADPDDPGHFVRWSGAAADEFRPRVEYGRYLHDTLARTVAAHPGRLEWRRARVTRVRPDADGVTVLLGESPPVRADEVVLATGSPAPECPVRPGAHPRFVPDPWRAGALDAVPADRPVLLVGTGLTAVDVALSLTRDGTRAAPVVAVSRRGLLPLSHTAEAAPPAVPDLDDCARLRDVVRVVRAAAGDAGDWRAVVDGLRPYLDRLWTALTPAEQERFLRHLARPWECHRHRMAPAVAERIAGLRAAGLLEVRAGGVDAITPARDGGLVGRFGTDAVTFGAVVNCAGPGRLPAAAGPLVTSLLADGLARVGPHSLGLDIGVDGRLIGAAGTVQERLWLIGALRRGARWETTAVPEIRSQARRLATDLAGPVTTPALSPAA